jgi:zinc transport system ATP-binding protein
MNDNIIVMENVSFAYGKDDILKDVNFIVKRQEYVGVIGANGAGKSTLMKLILGQLSPDSGKVTVNADSIGYVPQVGFTGTANFPANVSEIVMTGLQREVGMFHLPKKEHKEKVLQTLELVGMQDYRGRMLSELSGGQQQRVMIARALIQNPELLVLDEPLTGIDREAGEQLYQLLYKLNSQYGMTIVMVTHNMEQVARYTNRFYHVSNGSVHLDKSSILCDEVLKDKMIIAKPKRYTKHKVSSKQDSNSSDLDKAENEGKEQPYDASYKGKSSKEQPYDASYKGKRNKQSSQNTDRKEEETC